MRILLLALAALLLLSASSNAAVVTWTSNSGGTEDGFNVYRAVKGGVFAKIGNTVTNVTTFTDTPPAGSIFCYKVTAFVNVPGGTTKESAFSNADCLSPQAPSGTQAN